MFNNSNSNSNSNSNNSNTSSSSNNNNNNDNTPREEAPGGVGEPPGRAEARAARQQRP